jgi:hypothetical protein
MLTDEEVRTLMDKACCENAGRYLREFAEEVIAMRQRIRRLEKELEYMGLVPPVVE